MTSEAMKKERKTKEQELERKVGTRSGIRGGITVHKESRIGSLSSHWNDSSSVIIEIVGYSFRARIHLF